MIGKCDRCGREDEVVRTYGRLFCPDCVERLGRNWGAARYLRRTVEKERKRR